MSVRIRTYNEPKTLTSVPRISEIEPSGFISHERYFPGTVFPNLRLGLSRLVYAARNGLTGSLVGAGENLDRSRK